MQGTNIFDSKKYSQIIMLEIRILWISLHLFIILKVWIYTGVMITFLVHRLSGSVNFIATYSQISLAQFHKQGN